MAKKRTRKAARSIVVRQAPARPIVVRAAAPVAKRTKHRRSHTSTAGFSVQGLLSNERTGAMIGAGVLGLLDKHGTALPSIPVLGRAGTAGLALYYLSRNSRSSQLGHAATGCLAIAVYELMKEGHVSGVEGMNTV